MGVIRSRSDDVCHECPNRLLSFLSSTCFCFPLAARAVYRVVLGPSKAFHVPSLVFERRKCITLSGGAQGGFEKKLKKVFGRSEYLLPGLFRTERFLRRTRPCAKRLRAVGARTGRALPNCSARRWRSNCLAFHRRACRKWLAIGLAFGACVAVSPCASCARTNGERMLRTWPSAPQRRARPGHGE